ncbi:cadherin-1 [Thalassophryne amazonica]|uniref:cadherin-1 n=1 Tax=Thalassophryne amazonica TaxID=390379 RepID=UPI001472351A|nr:cadherin-1 [Thalassophryne amazonica]
MGSARLAGLGVLIVVFQALTLVIAKEPACIPHFKSDNQTFIVFRRQLHHGDKLGRVRFDDCSGRIKLKFRTSDRQFSIHSDGMLKVKKQLCLHEAHRKFFVHMVDLHGHKSTLPVQVVYHGNHSDHRHGRCHQDVYDSHHHRHHKLGSNPHGFHRTGNHLHGHGHHRNDSQQHHLSEEHSAHNSNNTNEMHLPVLHFPVSSKGLKRSKRDWVIPPISISENDKGPYPKQVVQIRSDRDKEQIILYSISGPGADEPPLKVFRMEERTGWFYVLQELDREKQDKYLLKARAQILGSGKAEDPMDLIVKVLDQNDNKPVFIQDTFRAEVPEASSKGFPVVTVEATDADDNTTYNAEIAYSIISQTPEEPVGLFFINARSGAILLNIAHGLDRETNPEYTLEVQAADLGGVGLTGKSKVIITVTDSNDHAPVFTQSSYEAFVLENNVGALVTNMMVTDGDDPHSLAWNAKFTIVGGDPNNHFSVSTAPSKDQGVLVTAKELDYETTSKYTLLIAVENEAPFAIAMPTSTTTVTVNVKDVNEAPIFSPEQKLVVKKEDLALDSELTQYTATDPDISRNQKVRYKVLRDPAGWLAVKQDTGLILVKSSMDRESPFVKDDKYTALIIAYDDDEVPATGTGTLVIQLEDVNDNAPTIDEREIRVCNKDMVPQLLSVTDKDGPGFAAPYSVILQGSSKTNWTAKMNDSKTGIILTLATDLPQGDYSVVLRVADNQGMEQDSTINAKVCSCTGKYEACTALREAGGHLPIILGILGAILLLLLLVLLLLMFLRRRRGEKKEPLLQDDDIRDNIYYYDEEGGGEDDQDYDLGVLHRGLDNRPDVFRNDVAPVFMSAPQYRPRPANPEEIGNFIDDNLKAADSDPTAPPYDSLLVFDYEGGGSDAGSLSSLNSSSSGDQDYDCLNEWGPRFKKLADMYGGGEDDML